MELYRIFDQNFEVIMLGGIVLSAIALVIYDKFSERRGEQ